jgi:hypothetical protein
LTARPPARIARAFFAVEAKYHREYQYAVAPDLN